MFDLKHSYKISTRLKEKKTLLYEKLQLLKLNIQHMIFLLTVKKNKDIMKYKNAFNGKRCFIIATGPSLTIADLELLSNEICIGVNSCVNVFDKTTWRPRFLCISDVTVWKSIGEKIDKVSNQVDTIFVGSPGIEPKSINAVKFSRDMRPSVYVATEYYKRTKEKKYNYYISTNMDKYFCDGPTVVFTAIQLAIYMGFAEVYLLGTDCNYSGQKKYSSLTEYNSIISDDVEEKMLGGYRIIKKEIIEKKINIKIYNSTRGGMLDVFERAPLEQVVS